jgi:hypothetical protein
MNSGGASPAGVLGTALRRAARRPACDSEESKNLARVSSKAIDIIQTQFVF